MDQDNGKDDYESNGEFEALILHEILDQLIREKLNPVEFENDD